MFEDFTFDQRVDSRARPHPYRESALSPREVYAEWPPPPPRDAVPATQCAGFAGHESPRPDDDGDGNVVVGALPPASETAVDSLARQLGRQTLVPDVQPQLHRQRLMNNAAFRHPEPAYALSGDLPLEAIPSSLSHPHPHPRPTAALPLPRPPPPGPDFALGPAWPQQQHDHLQRPQLRQPNVPPPSHNHPPNTRAIRQNLIESMIVNGDQCNIQNSESSTPVSAPWTSLLTVGPLVAASDGMDAQMTNPGFPLEVDSGSWGERGEDGEPIIRLLSYRRAGAPTRIQKVGLGYRSSQDTALRCANLKKNVTKMRRRDRKPSKASVATAETPST